MKFLLTGNEENEKKREKYLRALCLERGHSLPSHGPWDAVILPLPNAAIDEETAFMLPRGQKVVCGKTDAEFEQLARKRGWTLLRVLEDEAFARANAALTAEGAVYAAMAESDRCLNGAKCLVAGYGRIGKKLANRLLALGARVTVAARRRESRQEAGENSIDIPDIAALAGRMDVIFNTIPSRVFSPDALRAIHPQTPVIELASAPYGMDPEKARGMKLRYRLESGLPGRYCPQSAAKILLDYVEREVQHE